MEAGHDLAVGIGGVLVREVISVWFLYTGGRYQLPAGTSVAITVLLAVLLAAGVLLLVRITAAAHTDPDTAFVAWLRVIAWAMMYAGAICMICWEPTSGAPLLALVLFATYVARRDQRRETEHARLAAALRPTVPHAGLFRRSRTAGDGCPVAGA